MLKHTFCWSIDSLALPDRFFPVFLWWRKKGSGDIVSIERCQHATIFVACELLQINTADQDDVLAIVKSREMYMEQLKRQSWRSRLALSVTVEELEQIAVDGARRLGYEGLKFH